MSASAATPLPEVLTPDQAADYLQVSKETVYRFIRDGQLVASKLGRSYRIPKRSIDLLLWRTRTRQDITLREYTGDEIAEFLEADMLDDQARSVADRFGAGRGDAGIDTHRSATQAR
jgi:excisionase family DNA binding protein